MRRWQAIILPWRQLDWWLLAPLLLLVAAGLLTMSSLVGEGYFFDRQLAWFAISLAALFAASMVDWRFLRQSGVLVALFFLSAAALLYVAAGGIILRGAQSWLSFGALFLQPVDFVKLILILVLAKYFSRRHIAIAHFRHIFISGLYALIPFVLVLLQPDFGSAMIIFAIWLGVVIFAGISKKHLLLVFGTGILSLILLWLFVLAPYQKQRIVTFLHPLADIRGAGYSSFQSTIAVGSGQFWGKGLGYGTQSRLKFLPEYQTDFIFAAFAEEWGLVGSLILFLLFAVVIWRILKAAMLSAGNFETLFGVGLAIWFFSHLAVSVGMNVGLLPVTGLPLPFVSYGGSHLLAEFLGVGILLGMSRYGRAYHRDDIKNEFLGMG